MSEPITAEQWLYATLNDDDTLSDSHGITGVYTDIVPDDATYPVALITEYTPGTDLAYNNAQRILTNPTYIVRAIDATASKASLENAADRIDTLLHRQSDSDAGVLSCVREQTFSLTEFDEQENQHYRHLGGIYRLNVQ
jgi:hypothetical protein